MLHTACKPRFREHRGTLNQSRVSPGARGGSVAASPGVGALLRDAQPAPSALMSAAAALSLQVAAPDLGTAAQRQEEGHGARAEALGASPLAAADAGVTPERGWISPPASSLRHSPLPSVVIPARAAPRHCPAPERGVRTEQDRAGRSVRVDRVVSESAGRAGQGGQ